MANQKKDSVRTIFILLDVLRLGLLLHLFPRSLPSSLTLSFFFFSVLITRMWWTRSFLCERGNVSSSDYLSLFHSFTKKFKQLPNNQRGKMGEKYTRKKRYTYKDESNYYKTLCACFAMQHSWHDLCLCICTVKEIYGYIKTLPIPMIGMCTLRHCFQTLTPCIVFWSLSIQKYIYPQHC